MILFPYLSSPTDSNIFIVAELPASVAKTFIGIFLVSICVSRLSLNKRIIKSASLIRMLSITVLKTIE